jgi:putative N-acetylmannosamine-6-phosphate epimerase
MGVGHREQPVNDMKHGLMVSCQAHGDHPSRNLSIIAALEAWP